MEKNNDFKIPGFTHSHMHTHTVKQMLQSKTMKNDTMNATAEGEATNSLMRQMRITFKPKRN